MSIEESDKKLGELILFICQKSANDTYFGSTKLNKLLYYSDFNAHSKWGATITGADYWHLTEGPAPERFCQVRDTLLNSKPPALAIQLVAFPSFWQKRPVQLRPPDLSLFRGHELALVEEVIEENRGLTGKQISHKSHKEWGWKVTSERERIPLSSFSLAPETEKLSEEEIEQLLSPATAVAMAS